METSDLAQALGRASGGSFAAAAFSLAGSQMVAATPLRLQGLNLGFRASATRRAPVPLGLIRRLGCRRAALGGPGPHCLGHLSLENRLRL